MKPIVIIESPFAGRVSENVYYAIHAVKDSLTRGEVPFASHLIYAAPYHLDEHCQPMNVLEDSDPVDRSLGISAGHEFLRVAEMVAVYEDLGISPGMQERIDLAHARGVKVEYRRVSGWAE